MFLDTVLLRLNQAFYDGLKRCNGPGNFTMASIYLSAGFIVLIVGTVEGYPHEWAMRAVALAFCLYAWLLLSIAKLAKELNANPHSRNPHRGNGLGRIASIGAMIILPLYLGSRIPLLYLVPVWILFTLTVYARSCEPLRTVDTLGPRRTF